MKNREDIQVLRGIAVLLVVFFHARLNLLGAGFLGVDIFFVISGFLITSMVTSQIHAGTFSFREFYFRRAKRLLPAAYTTFLVTALLSMWLLTSAEFSQFSRQLWGAVTFTSNIVLWRQGSYFGGEADLKPLLHTWSLAIEEQYYLVLPAALFFVPMRHWLKGVLLLLTASASLCVAVMAWKPDVAFYLFPTRAWELAIGSLGVFLIQRPVSQTWARRLFWPALLCMLALPIFPISTKHPGLDAVIVCCATLVVILAGHPFLNHGRVISALSRVGDWSYSLYLVHWPIFALASNVWVGALPEWVKWSGLALSMVLAWLQYTFIENPIRNAHMAPTRARIATVLCLTLALMAVPFVFLLSPGARLEYAEVRRGNTGLSPNCAFKGVFEPLADCQTAINPTTLVWGDSYAMHLVPGIKQEFVSEGIVQATKYVCGPLVGLAPIAHYPGATQNRHWAAGCLAFNDSVLEHLKHTPSIHTVVLSSVFKQYMTTADFHNLSRTGDSLREESGTIEAAVMGLGRTVAAVRALGKAVVIIAPPPAMDWDAGRCAERILRGMPVLGPDADCVTKDADYRRKRAEVLVFLRLAAARLGVSVITFDEVLRSGEGYGPVVDGKILYIANGHLSVAGSEYLARVMQLRERIKREAR